jgi:hypothetical protein
MDEKTEQKPLTFRRTIEQSFEFPNGLLNLENLSIAGKDYSLAIANKNGRLSLDFNEGEYQIIIDKQGITFRRTEFRPNHDHNDQESLQVGVNDAIPGVKKGEIKWLSRFPYPGEGRDFFRVEFGPRTVDY